MYKNVLNTIPKKKPKKIEKKEKQNRFRICLALGVCGCTFWERLICRHQGQTDTLMVFRLPLPPRSTSRHGGAKVSEVFARGVYLPFWGCHCR